MSSEVREECIDEVSAKYGVHRDIITRILGSEMVLRDVKELYDIPKTKKLTEKKNIPITGLSIRKLLWKTGDGWLDDETINFYFLMIQDIALNRTLVLGTHFYEKLYYAKRVYSYEGVRSWSGRGKSIFDYDLVLVPIHLGSHWCLGVIDVYDKKVRCYDSMEGSYDSKEKMVLANLMKYVMDEYLHKLGKTPSEARTFREGWTKRLMRGAPQQANGSDCGVFVCQYARCIALCKMHFDFDESDIPRHRKRMALDILEGKISVM